MPVYICVRFNVTDSNIFDRYAVESRKSIKQHGGRVISRGAPTELIGKTEFSMGAILEFSDRESALNWFNSDEYQSLSTMRDQSSDQQFILYDSYEGD